MQHDESPAQSSRPMLFLQVMIVVALAGTVGATLALFLPGLQHAWHGLALLLLWMLVELALGALVLLGSIPGKPERLPVAAAVVAGFYVGALLAPVVAA